MRSRAQCRGDVADRAAGSRSQDHRRFPAAERHAIRKTCAKFVDLCRRIGVLKGEVVDVDGSKFKAVNNRDRNFTKGRSPAASPIWKPRSAATSRRPTGSTGRKPARRGPSGRRICRADITGSARRSNVCWPWTRRWPMPLTGRYRSLTPTRGKGHFVKADFAYEHYADIHRCPAGQALTHRTTTEQQGLQMRRYWTNACRDCALKSRCTTGQERRVSERSRPGPGPAIS